MSIFKKRVLHPVDRPHRFRWLFLYGTVFLLLEGLFGAVFWHYLKEKEDLLLVRHIEALENAYSVILDNYKLASQIIYEEVIDQPNVIALLRQIPGANAPQQQDIRQKLLQMLSPAYQRLHQHNLRQLHFHLPDGKSFLRFHRPEKFGDLLFPVRTSVRLANQQKRFVYGFEEGRIYNGFRYVFPILTTDPTGKQSSLHLGSVETSVSFAAFKHEMASLFPGCATFILRRDVVDAKVFQDEKDNYILSEISDRFVTQKSLSQMNSKTLDCSIIASLNQQLRAFVTPKLEQGLAFAQVLSIADGTAYVTTFVPVKNFEQQSVAYIILYEKDLAIQGYYQTFYWSLVGVTGTNLLLISFIGFAHRSYGLLRRKNNALEQEVAARITAETNERAKATQLAEALTHLKAHARWVQSEKMSALNRLVAGISHEINNPISFILGNIQPGEEYLESLLSIIDYYQQQCHSNPDAISQIFPDIDLDFIRQDFPRMLASMKQGAERVRSIVQTLRNFSRLDESGLKLVNLHEGLESSLMIITHRLKPTGKRSAISIVRNYEELPLVECYPGLLNQAFLSILTNAVDALDTINWFQGNEQFANNGVHLPTIRLITTIAPNETVKITIANNGPPIPPDLCDRIFDPFFTTKPIGKGTGLGLSTTHAIVVEHHGGKLACTTSNDRETLFTIQIPILQTNFQRQTNFEPEELSAAD